jgi:hypothetical protein
MDPRFIPTVESGTYPETVFGPLEGRLSRVLFVTDEGHEWVGVFDDGDSHFDAVLPLGDEGRTTVLVIAGGRGYLLDSGSRELIRESSWDYATAAIAIPNRELAIVVDGHIRAYAVAREGDQIVTRPRGTPILIEFEPERLALDGIVFEDATEEQVTGLSWHIDGWYRFTLSLSTLTIIDETLASSEWDYVDNR